MFFIKLDSHVSTLMTLKLSQKSKNREYQFFESKMLLVMKVKSEREKNIERVRDWTKIGTRIVQVSKIVTELIVRVLNTHWSLNCAHLGIWNHKMAASLLLQILTGHVHNLSFHSSQIGTEKWILRISNSKIILIIYLQVMSIAKTFSAIVSISSY